MLNVPYRIALSMPVNGIWLRYSTLAYESCALRRRKTACCMKSRQFLFSEPLFQRAFVSPTRRLPSLREVGREAIQRVSAMMPRGAGVLAWCRLERHLAQLRCAPRSRAA